MGIAERIRKGAVALGMSLALAGAFVPVIGLVSNAQAEAATNAAATAAINNIKKQTGSIPGQCGWKSWNPYPSSLPNCEAGCWYFMANVEKKLVGCYPSGTSGYRLTNPGNFNTVGTVTDSSTANPSSSALQTLMKKAYPGDVIQFKGGPSGWGSYQHTAIVEAVDDTGITIYQHTADAHVSSTKYTWSYFYNTYLDFDAWTSYTKGITLYHYKSYGSVFPDGSSSSKPTISGASYPTTLKVGQCFGVKGTITSPSKITAVSAGIYNSAGKWVNGGTAKPNTTSYNLADLDNYVLFNKISAGTYTYAVYATNSAGQTCLLNKKFTVSSSHAKPSLSGANYPTSIKYGKCFGLKGTINGNGSNLKSVTAAVYTTGGTLKTGKTLSVNCSSVSIAKSLDNYVLFNKLPRGTYVYKVIAKNGAGTYTLLSKQFKVY